MWNTWQGKLTKGLAYLGGFTHLVLFRACILFYKSLVMPLFEYADLLWGDKRNVSLMSSLQVLQNKAAKIILHRLLYSSASHALVTLKWIPLEKRRFQRRCVHTCIYKCLNELITHILTLEHNNINIIITPEIKSILDSPALKGIGENKGLPITL